MSITSYLPSRRFLLTTLVIVVIIVSGTVVYTLAFAKKNDPTLALETKNKNVKSESVMIASLVEQDDDNDGVRDWEEALWGTSSVKADTDDDGISDLDEITEKKTALSDSSDTVESDPTETDDFARSIFASIISLKESGNLTEDNLKVIANNTTTAISEQQQLPDTYSMGDITIVTPDSLSRTAYAKALYSLFTSATYGSIGEEIPLIAEFVGSGSSKSTGSLKQSAKLYNELAIAVKKISTPSDATDITLSLANTLTNISVSLENLLQFRDNSMVGIIGLSQYKIETDEFFSYNIRLRDYVVTHGLYIQ